MGIQIFGKSKCFDTQKAERYFKERKISFQRIDLPKFGMSRGELTAVLSAVGGIQALVDPKSKDYERSYIAYLASDEAKFEKLLEFPGLMRTPIVRNGRQAAIGFCPEIWERWK